MLTGAKLKLTKAMIIRTSLENQRGKMFNFRISTEFMHIFGVT